MRLLLSCVWCCAFVSAVGAQDKGKWVTIKGQVVFPNDKDIPKRDNLKVETDKQHCLSKGAILDESVIVNPKNRGVKNVVVFLRPNNNNLKADFAKQHIHPDDAKRKPAEVVIDQPCCMFVKRVTAARVGDTLVVKNPSPVAHNFFWDSGNNGSHNPTLAPKTNWKMPNALVQESAPIQYKCSIHPWMTGYVRVFDHPYYAVTDDDGKFEIKNAPAGNFRIVYWHENGLLGGAKGRAGEPINISGPGPTMEMSPPDFEVWPRGAASGGRGARRRGATRDAASSISSPDCVGAKLNRSADFSTSSETPIARKTGLGSRLPLEHADPVEQATRSRSSDMSSRSARHPGNDTFSVVGITSAAPISGPFSTTGAHSRRSALQSRSRCAASFTRFASMLRTAISSAVAIPTASATGSVPGRRPACWCPP